ncbi:fatty acid desaturase [Pseudofrankia sp. BMG5.36]|uniref:acyl-CoA desaturase n=1 Tax=Pseudofrankia sp. BMG5.36 TaxID=1834512 RepID=UPI0012FFC074|nr:fatty acid desaturase [Pseudofrankia sp. BMG5.36]
MILDRQSSSAPSRHSRDGRGTSTRPRIDGSHESAPPRSGVITLNVVWLALLTVLAVAAVGRVVYHGVSHDVLAWTVGSYFVTGFGVTVGYHRYLTHEGFRCSAVLRAILLFTGAMAIQGTLESWRRTHLAHHAHTDVRDLDPHTPNQYDGFWMGLWHSHVGWMMVHQQLPEPFDQRNDVDLLVRWQRQYYAVPAVLSFLIPWAATGWQFDGLLVAGFLRVFLLFHFTASINSVCHIWGTHGSRKPSAVRTARLARDFALIALPTMGEGWHWMHHVIPGCVVHGSGLRPDPTKWLIWSLERSGLARDVKWYRKERARILGYRPAPVAMDAGGHLDR